MVKCTTQQILVEIVAANCAMLLREILSPQVFLEAVVSAGKIQKRKTSRNERQKALFRIFAGSAAWAVVFVLHAVCLGVSVGVLDCLHHLTRSPYNCKRGRETPSILRLR